MARRPLEFINSGEERLDKVLNASMTIGIFRPIMRNEDCRDGNRFDRLAARNHVRIVFVAERGGKVVVGKGRGKWYREEMQAVYGFHLRHRSGGLAGDQHRSGNLTA